MKFHDYICLKEGKEHFTQPHVISVESPIKIPAGIKQLVEAFKKSREVPIGKEIDGKIGGEKDVTLRSKKLYLVGGAVRDHLLGHTPRNFNLVTDAHPEEVIRILKHASITAYRKDQDGKVIADVDGNKYEIKTMRKNSKDMVYTTDPAEDTEHRDFTINSLFYDLIGNKIIDHTGGLRHLKDNVVRFIGKPNERIAEDGIRKHRYARMVNKLPNATIDPDIKKHMSTDDDLPADRVREEFWKGFEDPHTNAQKYIKTYNELGLLEQVFPKLKLNLDFPNCKTCKSRPVALAHLLKDNRPPVLVEKLRELKYNDREIKDAVYLINLTLFEPDYIYDFKRELIHTSLTKRQIVDWAKTNNLNVEVIDKMVDYRLQTRQESILGIMSAHAQQEQMRAEEAAKFKKLLG